jgi:hypothetical protein
MTERSARRSGYDKHNAGQGRGGESRDGEGCQARPEPQLEHGRVIASLALEYPERAPPGTDQCDAFGGENGDRRSECSIASASQRAEPQISETPEFPEADRGV